MEKKQIKKFCSNEIFQVWDHLVSHNYFLLRCAISNTRSENIDIIFFYTKYLELPTTLRGLELVIDHNHSTQQQIAERAGITFDEHLKVFSLKSMEKIFYIAAYSASIHINTLPMFDSPLHAMLGIREPEISKYANHLVSVSVLV
ncbi:MAG: hypothetical protein JNM09_13845 [Blastocatellia bacterium]|nr:hypothetical protein [Blastocatellia bacterium]